MELRFLSDTRHRKQWFTGLSFSHPAKMSLPLQIWIIENYTKEGETILDPMAGSGTLLVACSLGRNVIAVELEQKFIDMMNKNWEKIRERGCQLGYSMGKCQIIQGDARNLEGVLADKIISSPPYEQSLDRWAGDNRNKLMEDKGLHAMPKADKIITSPPFAGSVVAADGEFYKKKAIDTGRNPDGAHVKGASEGIENPNNISNLPYGAIDKIVSSPPYAEMTGKGLSEAQIKLCEKTQGRKFSKASWRSATDYSNDPSNIGNLSYGEIDKIITSPPYEGSEARDRSAEGWWNEERELAKAGGSAKIARGYQAAEDNIGNLRSDTYLEAMLQVYQQCHKVLKSGGLMMLVTKNFIRNKKVVRLDLDTIKLCEQAGFIFKERHYRRLSSQSFWRVIAQLRCDHRKGSKQNPRCELGLKCPVGGVKEHIAYLIGLQPEKRAEAVEVIEKLCPHFINSVPKLDKEDVLIFQKGG